jgi:hypothetical protein
MAEVHPAECVQIRVSSSVLCTGNQVELRIDQKKDIFYTAFGESLEIKSVLKMVDKSF